MPKRNLLFLLAIATLCAFTEVRASSVLGISFEELVGNSELVIEGRVTDVAVRQDSEKPLVWTRITLEVLDVVAGEYSAEQLALSFLGGSVGKHSLNVNGMTMPELGERGVFFIASTTRAQVHPLLGWEQGHFRVEIASDGDTEVKTYSRIPVLAIGPANQQQHGSLSTGVARGLQLPGQQQPQRRGMRLDAFKAAIKEIRAVKKGAR